MRHGCEYDDILPENLPAQTALSKYFIIKRAASIKPLEITAFTLTAGYFIYHSNNTGVKRQAPSANKEKSGRRAAFMYMQNYSTFLLSGPGVVTITFSTSITRAPFAARRPFVAFSTVAFTLSAISPSAS